MVQEVYLLSQRLQVAKEKFRWLLGWSWCLQALCTSPCTGVQRFGCMRNIISICATPPLCSTTNSLPSLLQLFSLSLLNEYNEFLKRMLKSYIEGDFDFSLEKTHFIMFLELLLVFKSPFNAFLSLSLFRWIML